MADPFHRLLQDHLHASNSFCWKGKEDTGGAEEKSIVELFRQGIRSARTLGLWLDSRARPLVSCSENGCRRRIMTARDLIELWAARLTAEQAQLGESQGDRPFAPVSGRLVQAVGTLYLYE